MLMGSGRSKVAWQDEKDFPSETPPDGTAQVVPVSCSSDDVEAMELEALKKYRDSQENKRKLGKGGNKLDDLPEKFCFFSIMDIIEDQVHLRQLNVWSFLLIYVFFVLSLLHFGKVMKADVKKLSFVADPPVSVIAGPGTSSIFPTDRLAKCTVQNADGSPRQGATVTPVITDFIPMDRNLPCATNDIGTSANTLLSYQYKGICDATIKGIASSNDLGIGQIAGFEIHGPAGVYKVRLESNVDGAHIKSDATYQSNVISAVVSMEVVSASDFSKALGAPNAVTIGQPLLEQPAIILRDSLNQPVQGVSVHAFCNPDAAWPPQTSVTPSWLRRGQKLAELSGSVSQPSDANGVAVFESLTVIGTTYRHTNFVFVTNGQSFLPWNDPFYSPASVYPELMGKAGFRPSTQLVSPVGAVDIHALPQSTIVVEGSSVSVQVKVTNLDGSPATGIICYALMYSEYGNLNTMLFRRQLEGIRKKELINPRSTPSDSQGIASFAVIVSTYGNTVSPVNSVLENPSNELGFTVSCNGFQSVPVLFSITSRVNTVTIKRFLRKEAYVASPSADLADDGSDTFVAVVRITDSFGNGVGGKNVKIQATGDFAATPVFPAWSITEASSDSGFAVVSFRVSEGSEAMAASYSSGIFNVVFSVDGVQSEESTDDLILRLRTPPAPEICQNIVFYSFTSLNATGQVETSYNIFERRPVIMSGQTVLIAVLLLGPASGIYVHFPEGNYTNGLPQQRNYSSYSSGGRRLVDDGEKRRLAIERYRTAVESGTLHVQERARRLSGSSSLGSIHLTTSQAYSDKGEEKCYYDGSCQKNIPYEPQLIVGEFLPQLFGGAPTIEDLNSNPGFLQSAIQYQGARGTHRVRIKATLEVAGLPTQTCESPPLALEVENPFYSLTAFDQKSLVNHNLVAYDIQSYNASEEVELSVYVEPWDAKAHLALLTLSDQWFSENGFYCKIEEFPENWAPVFGNYVQNLNGGLSLDNNVYTLRQLGASHITLDGITFGMLKVGLRFKPEGIFGRFGIFCGSAGMLTNVVRFDISPPLALSLHIITPPGLIFNGTTLAEWYTQKAIPQQPIVRVLSNGQPINGVSVVAEFIPEPGGGNVFERLLAFSNYDAFTVMYSLPSGYSDHYLNTMWSGQDGVAAFTSVMLTDGLGCMKLKFSAGDGVFSELTPKSPMCFRPIVSYEITNQPPSSVPLGMSFGPLAAISNVPSRFIVQMSYDDIPDFFKWGSGVALARISIVKYNDLDFEQGISASGFDAASLAALTTRNLLADNVCLWIGTKEYTQRCSPLQIVTTDPYIKVSFEVDGTKWRYMISPGDNIKLLVSDISLSPLYKAATVASIPSNFASLSKPEKAEHCMEILSASSNATAITNTISLELTPQSAREIVPPPAVVEVGNMFTTRIIVLSKSGAPLPDVDVRVGLVSSLNLNPSVVGGNLLQSLATVGKNLKAYADPHVMLGENNTVKRTGSKGTASFPLTIERAVSGTYVLMFEAVGPPSVVLYTSQPFTVNNPIERITQAGGAWGNVELEEEDFKKQVGMPKKLEFQVTTSGGDSLETLENEKGVQLSIRIVLKGASKKVRESLQKVRERSEKAANAAAAVVSSVSTSSILKSSAGTFVQAQARKAFAESPFARLSPELMEACRSTNLRALEQTYNLTHVRPAMLGTAIKEDPDTINPGSVAAQFVRTLTGSGATMETSESMVPELVLDDVTLSDLRFISGATNTDDGSYTGTYEVIRPIQFKFVEDSEYVWSIAINGLEPHSAAFDTFLAVKGTPTGAELFFNWVMTACAGILAVIILTANMVIHRWQWIVLGIPCAIAVGAIAPYLKKNKEAMGGLWPFLAIIDCAFIAISLIWVGLLRARPFITVPAKVEFLLSRGFARQRLECFEEYAQRRMLRCLQKQYEAHGCKMGFVAAFKQMFHPFGAEYAFYYPSQFLVALQLSLLTFLYCLAKAAEIRNAINESLMGLLDKTINACIRLIMQMEAEFQKITRVQLPDSATAFMLDQLRMVKGWFTTLIDAIGLGMLIGIIIAALAITVAMLQFAYCFRKQVLSARCGIHTYKDSDASVVYDSLFMGQSIATTIVSFIVIVFLVVLIVLPFAWPLLWNLIWSLKWYMLSLCITKILQIILEMIAKKLMFTPTFTKNRPAASIYMFWQTWITIIAGISTAIMRFVFAILGVIVGMPQLAFPCTSPQLNAVYLLDAPHKSYLAAVQMYHRHNNPIAITAIRTMRRFVEKTNDSMRKSKDDLENGGLAALQESLRKRNKRWVILILLRFPWLAKHRKAYIQEKAEEAIIEKIRKKRRAPRKSKEVKPVVPLEELMLNKAFVHQQMAAQRHDHNINELEDILHRLQHATSEDARKAIQEMAQKFMAALEEAEKDTWTPRSDGQSIELVEDRGGSTGSRENLDLPAALNELPRSLNPEPRLGVRKPRDLVTRGFTLRDASDSD